MTAKAPDDANVSEAIKVARVLCIFFMMFVHVWPGTSQFEPARGLSGWDITFHFFADILGRSSVPLLSIVSGWLVAQTFRGASELARSRFKSLIVPMVLWNILMFAALTAYDASLGENWARPREVMTVVNAIFAVTAPPITLPLAFLRDLFVCVLLAPFMLMAARKATWAGPVLVAASVAWLLGVGASWLILRPLILVLFTLGLMLGAYRRPVGRALIRWPAVLLAVAVTAAIFPMALQELQQQKFVFTGAAFNAVDLVRRLAVAYLFWCIALALAGWRWGRTISRLEPYIFFVFCSHVLVLKILVPVGRAIFGGYYSPTYPIYFFLQPFLALAIGVGVCWLLARWAPAVLRPFNSGKVPSVRPPVTTRQPAASA